jgi:hypothetical protein
MVLWHHGFYVPHGLWNQSWLYTMAAASQYHFTNFDITCFIIHKFLAIQEPLPLQPMLLNYVLQHIKRSMPGFVLFPDTALK